MAKPSPSQSCGVASGRFWRNVTLIAVAHVALITGLIRWSLAARASSSPESIVWLGTAQGLAATGGSENDARPPAKRGSTSCASYSASSFDEPDVRSAARADVRAPVLGSVVF